MNTKFVFLYKHKRIMMNNSTILKLNMDVKNTSITRYHIISITKSKLPNRNEMLKNYYGFQIKKNNIHFEQ